MTDDRPDWTAAVMRATRAALGLPPDEDWVEKNRFKIHDEAKKEWKTKRIDLMSPSIIRTFEIQYHATKLGIDFKSYDISSKDDIKSFLDGRLKWDGCLDLRVDTYMHFCGEEDTAVLYEFIKEIYKLAPQMPGWDGD